MTSGKGIIRYITYVVGNDRIGATQNKTVGFGMDYGVATASAVIYGISLLNRNGLKFQSTVMI